MTSRSAKNMKWFLGIAIALFGIVAFVLVEWGEVRERGKNFMTREEAVGRFYTKEELNRMIFIRLDDMGKQIELINERTIRMETKMANHYGVKRQ